MCNYLPLLKTVGNLLCKQAEARLPSPRAYTPQYNTLFRIYLCERANRFIYNIMLRLIMQVQIIT